MTDPTGPTGPLPGAAVLHVLVVADGDVPERALLDAAWPGWLDGVTLVVAADGGYRRARGLGLEPDILVGDLDSLAPSLVESVVAAGIPVERSPVDKDESDSELAVVLAVRHGAGRITVLGAFGGSRMDHALANIWLLAHPGLEGVAVALLDARTRVTLVMAPGPDGGPVTRALPGETGGVVSLLPLGGDVTGITTHGLRYPLVGEPLLVGPSRGLSNVRTAAGASVTVTAGRLLVVEAAPAG